MTGKTGFSGTKELVLFNLDTNSYIETKVYVDYYYAPGNYSGSPENCYPDEEELNIDLESAFIVDDESQLRIELPRFLYNSISEYIVENYIDNLLENIDD